MDTILILLQIIINILFIVWITILEREVREHTRCLNTLSFFLIQKDKKLKSKFQKYVEDSVKEKENK